MRAVTIIDAPTSAGAYVPGQEYGPAALRAAGLVARLRDSGCDVADGGACDPFRWAPDPRRPRAANLEAVADRARQVARLVRAVGGDRLALVLGGDCTTGVGTVAGLDDPALVYVDRHADLELPSTTDEGALDWMGVAHMIDADGAEDALAGVADRRPILDARRLAFLGLDAEQTPPQDALIARHEVPVVGAERLAAAPEDAAAEALATLPGDADVAVHFDCDVLDFLDAPLAENCARGLGPSLTAATAALRTLLADPRVVALTVTELNPHHGAADGTDTGRLVDALASALAP